jgi:hypothetical protein
MLVRIAINAIDTFSIRNIRNLGLRLQQQQHETISALASESPINFASILSVRLSFGIESQKKLSNFLKLNTVADHWQVAEPLLKIKMAENVIVVMDSIPNGIILLQNDNIEV